ncbi:hypothetical protein DTO013E5_7821 [Penicillium roqueforti]|uniref:uncharacterized protein n=1 Tax=Penicillium solitum TaxID=60172 RepID=UPI002A19B225|nr:hypothetical protein LCP963914a_6736 [Penicillium roqueforti]KAJ5695354.1 hypothetical protein N7536_005766 [Penicillium majusculum]KAJ5878274.1 hypothetical protein N7455_001739 [Penicillium solitum]KAI2737216.1 hypothetical protein DTO012A1_7844 [Penicillium roqueforti]KAI2749410.1 hypothetical protein DTO013F2_5471 [Penicillium roqueforti]
MPRQHQHDKKCYQHFALVYLDQEGKVCHETSPSISDSAHAILSPQVTSEFLEAMAQSSEGGFPTSAPALPDSQPLIPPPSLLAPTVLGEAKPGASLQRRRKLWDKEHSLNVQTATISVSNKRVLRQYYEKVFRNLQQKNCRVIAKAYVRLVEPRKQAQYPYNGRKTVAGKKQQFSPEETKPPWWPPGVSHREPDHLPKAERIALLVHVLCELRTSHRITAQKLKGAGQPIQQHISPSERLKLLDELYRVREEEEMFLDAVADGNDRISISRANLPECIEAACRPNYPGNKRSQGKQQLKRELPNQNMSIRIRPTQELILSKVPADQFAVVELPSQRHLLIQSGLKSSPSPASPRYLKRRRLCAEDGNLPTWFASMNYSSFPIACHSLLPDGFVQMPEFQSQGDLISWDIGLE